MANSHLDNDIVVQDWGSVTHVASGEHKVEDLSRSVSMLMVTIIFIPVMTHFSRVLLESPHALEVIFQL